MKTFLLLLKGLFFEKTNEDSKKIANEFFDLDNDDSKNDDSKKVGKL